MNSQTNSYQDALDYIYSFLDYSLTRNFQYSPERFDLGRMAAFLDLLGNPHQSYPVIHLAGTKGKGSTSALIASSYHAQGYRVGLYTSPHLQDFTERIQLNGQQISPEDVVELVEFIKPIVTQVEHLTTFEITTALGFLYFARQKVDAAVIEVGLGGRLDATNLVDPLVSVITSLSLDHMAVLGDTLEKIAFEKAGIIKPGKPVVLAPQADEARSVIEAITLERGCRLVQVGSDFCYSAKHHSLSGQGLDAWRCDAPAERIELQIPLLGLHQVENAATAYAALQIAGECGLPVTPEAIRNGFGSVRWPGRFEVLCHKPVVIVDSAHNRDSARRLRMALQDYLPGRSVILIFGVSEDKDVSGMFAELLPGVSNAIFTQSNHPRAMAPARLVELSAAYALQSVSSEPVEDAIANALKQAENENKVVLIAGSLFIAAAARDIWKKQFPERAAFGLSS